MKIKSAEFEVSAPDLAGCPQSARPEFAFIGRSNVGKSSLINMLSERRELAKVSDTPGKTRLINFFRMNGSWSLVDLPGYGYAAGAKHERAGFNDAVAAYLEKRENIACVFVLIDSRLPPQEIDVEFLRWLESVDVPFALIFTKADKQSAGKVQNAVALFKQTVFGGQAELPRIFTSSSTAKQGRTEILSFIAEILAADLPGQP